MANRDEVVSPSTEDATPLPIQVGEMVLPRTALTLPTSASVLQWIAAAGGLPWFPSQYAAATGIDRDSLDEPLAQLRVVGLIQIATWVRGVGQGYILTADGEQALAGSESILDLEDKPVAVVAVENVSEPANVPTSGGPSGFEQGEGAYLGLDERKPLVVAVLLIANLLWYFVGLVVAIRVGIPIGTFLTEGNSGLLHRIGGLSGFDLIVGQWWRLFSACFVHVNGLHILMNLMALALIGPLAELLWGRWRLAIIYIISGLAGSCLAMALHPDSLVVGASGAIWGVMTATLAWFMLFRDRLKPDIAMDAMRRLGVSIAMNAGLSFLPGISWEGHLGGAVAGFATAGLLNAIRVSNRRNRLIARVLLGAIPVLCVGGLVASMKWGESWASIRLLVAQDHMRRDEFTRQIAIAEATKAFNRDVAPLLVRLHPEPISPIEKQAATLLIRPGEKRNAAAVANSRTELADLKAAAEAAIEHLSAPPTGQEAIDQHRARTKEFVEARLRSLEMLLGMMDSPAIPTEAAWTAWGDSRRAADNLWKAISARQ
jgi:rhomboid protease GluP